MEKASQMEKSSSKIQLDSLDDDDPFFSSYLAEHGTSVLDSLLPDDNIEQLNVRGTADGPPTMKKRKTNDQGVAGTGAAAGTRAGGTKIKSSSSGGTKKKSSSSGAKSKEAQGAVAKTMIIPAKTHLSAESCRFVTTRGEVRGNTLISMEKVTNAVADKIKDQVLAGGGSSSSFSSSSSSGNSAMEYVEVVSRTPEDLELASLPRKIYDALSDINLNLLRQLIDTYFDECCVHASSNNPNVVLGRDNIYKFLVELSNKVPDGVRTVRHSRVVVDDAGNKAIKFKAFVTGTYLKAVRLSPDDLLNVIPSIL